MTAADALRVGRDRREAAYAAWQRADAAHERHCTPPTHVAEQDAWEAYTDACDDLGECITPGCHTPSPDHVHCPAHRPR